jgi:hypothetical protein
MEDREQRMGLAATKGGLELNDWLATCVSRRAMPSVM